MSDPKSLTAPKSRASKKELPVLNHPKALVQYGTESLPLIESDDDLVPLLRQATNDELAPLVEYIIKKGALTAELTQTRNFIQYHPDHRMYADDIAAEIQRFGANSIASFFRDGRGRRYREIVAEAAGKAGIETCSRDRIEDIEMKIVNKTFEQAWQKMNDEERKQALMSLQIHNVPGAKQFSGIAGLQSLINIGGFAPYKLAVITANAVANSVVGHGLSFAANAALTKGISIFAGPIGWAFSAFWCANIVAGPAYRVVMPCIFQVAAIRQSALAKMQATKRRERIQDVISLIFLLILILIAIFWTNHQH